ncbi:hypothetical protein ACHQM5_022274 [Ranunculus cassubicifolius]
MNSASVSPNTYTFTILLKACRFEQYNGKGIHAQILKLGFGTDVYVMNSLLEFYSKCGESLESAERVFEEMPERDVVTWNSLMGAYMNYGEISLAMKVFYSMPKKSIVSWNSMLMWLSKDGDMEGAQTVFEQMSARNEVSWNTMVSGYVRKGDMSNAKMVFDCMPCKTPTSLTAMISGYAKIGELSSANNIFRLMPVKNVINWNAMIAGYVHNKMFDKALDLFHEMLTNSKCRPNEGTLVTVLSACSHLSALEQGEWINSYIERKNIPLGNLLGNALGKRVFSQMERNFGIPPRIEHYGCMVDLFSRAGMVEEAFEFITIMPMEPNAVIWATLLGACKVHGKGGLAEVVSQKLRYAEPLIPGHMTLLSNMNASVGQWEYVTGVRKESVEKVPGCSLIQIGNVVHEFLVMDKNHEKSKEMYTTLNDLARHSKSFAELVSEVP